MTITLTREEAQQALDALDEYRDSTEDFRVANRCISLIETLRARLAQPEPEPVAWMQPDKEHLSLWNDEWHVVPLYTAPPQREELRRLHQSEREGWRYADELEQERKRLHEVNAELVVALLECTTWMEDLRASGDAGNWKWEADEYTRAIAALAKATGEQQ